MYYSKSTQVWSTEKVLWHYQWLILPNNQVQRNTLSTGLWRKKGANSIRSLFLVTTHSPTRALLHLSCPIRVLIPEHWQLSIVRCCFSCQNKQISEFSLSHGSWYPVLCFSQLLKILTKYSNCFVFPHPHPWDRVIVTQVAVLILWTLSSTNGSDGNFEL